MIVNQLSQLVGEKRSLVKLCMDPKVIPNEQMLEWKQEADEEAQEAGRLQTPSGLIDNKNIPIGGIQKMGLNC